MAKESRSVNPAKLCAELAALFPEGVIAAELRTPGDASLLYPEEALAIARAVPSRVAEFAAGRLCARRALAALGLDERPIAAAADRTPVWPDGVVGSITHTTGLAAAVVAQSRRFASLGIDIEGQEDLQPELWPRICTEAELAWLDSVPDASRAVAATMIFCAKEAFYKSQYPLTGERLGFDEVWVRTREWADSGDVLIETRRPLGKGLAPAIEYRGRYRLRAGYVCVGFWAESVRTTGG